MESVALRPPPTFSTNWLEPSYLADPYPLYAHVRRDMPVFYSPIFDLYFVTRYHDVRAALMDPQRFSSKFLIRTPYSAAEGVMEILQTGSPEVPILLTQDPPDHTRTRGLVSKAFVPRRIQLLEPQIYQIVDELIDGILAGTQANLVAQLAYPLPMTVICALLGMPLPDADKMKFWSQELVHLTTPGVAPDRQIAAAHNSVAFEAYLSEQIAIRRDVPRDDLLSDLVAARVAGTSPLNDLELVNMLIGLVFAGHETTTNLISNTILLLMKHPEVWEALRTDPGNAGDIVEETLRLDTPVHGMFRITPEPVELGEVEIPAGSKVFLLFASANRDAEVFPDPDRFDIQRANKDQHISFGRGIHFCLGASLARLEARIAIARLAQRLPNLRLAPDYTPTYMPSLMHRALQQLQVQW